MNEITTQRLVNTFMTQSLNTLVQCLCQGRSDDETHDLIYCQDDVIYQQDVNILVVNNLRHPYSYSWFAINLWGCGSQCQLPTPAGTDSVTNNIFFCVVPPTWPL